MKRIITFIITLLTMTTINAQTLTERQKNMAACACLMAQGDLERLEPAVRSALDNGVSINELKEAFSQLYAYTGFPRSLNALGVLDKVLQTKPDAAWQEGKPWTRPAEWDDAKAGYELGKKNQTQLSGGAFDYAFCPQDDYYLKAHLFGDIFAGDQLSKADREIVTVATLMGLDGVDPQLRAHKAGAVNMGNTKEQVDELCDWLDKKGYTLRSTWPKGEFNSNFAQYFIGNSYLAPMNAQNGGPVNVTFEPGCRNAWHIHHGHVQVLICVSGRGWYVEEGKEPVKMTPGTVVAIPEGAKHWHGAAADSWFQHLAYNANTQEGSSTEWLEPVSDEEYDNCRRCTTKTRHE